MNWRTVHKSACVSARSVLLKLAQGYQSYLAFTGITCAHANLSYSHIHLRVKLLLFNLLHA